MTDERERERFWRGLLVGMTLSSAFVGVLVGLWQRLRARGAPSRHPPTGP